MRAGSGKDVRQPSTHPGVFLLGFSAGIVLTSLLSDFVGEPSPSPSFGGGGDRRGLLALSDFADPLSTVAKLAVVDDGSPPSPPFPHQGEWTTTRDVSVGSMCRCGSDFYPRPGPPDPDDRYDTGVVQPPSLATGGQGKHFVMHRSMGGCYCAPKKWRVPTAPTSDLFLKKMRPHQCERPHPPALEWDAMPDFGVEETLPLFVGVLSYESPLTLENTLRNWLDVDLFRRSDAREVFVRLNHRSEKDDEVMRQFALEQERRGMQTPVTALGSPDENLHPGLAIADFCRRAESHPDGHPNGENLLMFLEKDWNLHGNDKEKALTRELELIFRAINSLTQRGVNYIQLKNKRKEVGTDRMWLCPSQGFPFKCTTSHQHRWVNQPFVLRCDWFLRYMEPFTLLDDPIMYGCRKGMQENRYCDWEEAMQDGRVAWSEGQWVMATLYTFLFYHKEVDG